MSDALRHQVPVRAFMTPVEVLKRLRVNARTLYRLMGEGSLPAVRIGRQWRVRPSDFDLWLRRQAYDAGVTTAPGLAVGTRGHDHGTTTTACQPPNTEGLIEGELK
jgi:excisionase family DNA binding protein